MKRLMLMLMLLVLTLVAAQCGGQPQAPAAPAAQATAPAPAAPKATDAPKAAAPTTAPAPAAPKATDAPKAAAPTTAAAAAPAAGDLGTAANPIKMAFVPSSDAQKLATSLEKLGQMLEKETGLKFKTTVPTSYAATVEAMNAGQIDVGWLNPLSYVVGNNRYGLELLLTTTRNGSKVYPFSIIVAKDSPIKTVQDLKGKKLASADPLSTSGNLYPRAYLTQQGVLPDKDVQWVYSGGHDKSVIALTNGQVDAAAVFGEFKGTPDARDRAKASVPDVYDKTRVLLNSADVNFLIPNDTVSVRKGLPADIRKKISDGLLAIAKTEDGIKELKALADIDGLVVGEPKDYAPINDAAKAANIDIGVVLNTPTPRPAATAAATKAP
ncbi:MAG: phosphate/phosphite/phosphonate ABC transporter substrate-binding protein [Anaerolineae bacterium]